MHECWCFPADAAGLGIHIPDSKLIKEVAEFKLTVSQVQVLPPH